MEQGFLDYFTAMGLGISSLLANGLHQNIWIWSVVALVGCVWAVGYFAAEGEDFLFLVKHILAVFISGILMFALVKVDLAQYSYRAPGKMEARLGNRQGVAIAPTYALFWFARTATISLRGIISIGNSTSIPNVVGQADLQTTDPEVLDDAQFKANLVIWNQLIAPYLLKQDPALAQALTDANLISEFMVPVPTSQEYTGSSGSRASAVVTTLAASKVNIGDMLCTLSTMVDSTAAKFGAVTWTSDNGTCIDTAIKLNLVSSMKRPATMPVIFNRPPQVAWDKGTAVANGMISAVSNGANLQSVTSVAKLYEMIGQSALLVAGNRYLADEDKVIVLGTACDKISSGDISGCNTLQTGLTSAARGLVSAQAYSGPEEKSGWSSKVGSWISGVLAFGVLGIFRIIMALFAGIVQYVIPTVMGLGVAFSFVASFIGVFMMLWPKRFLIACEWLFGPVLFVSLWTILHGIWTEIDTLAMVIVADIGSLLSGDRIFGTDVTSIIMSMGYMAMPFLSFTILFSSPGKGLLRATGISQRMVQGGAALAFFAARMGTQGISKMLGKGDQGAPGSQSPGSPPGGGGSSAPPSSAPASAGGGAPSSGGGQAAASSGGAASAPPAPNAGSAQSGSHGGGHHSGNAAGSAPSSAGRSSAPPGVPPSIGASLPPPSGTASSAPSFGTIPPRKD